MFSFAVATDPQYSSVSDSADFNPVMRNINTGVDNRKASFTLIPGDLVETGGASPTLYDDVATSLSLLDSTWYIVPGNHERDDDTTLVNFHNYFTYPPEGTSGNDSVWYVEKNGWGIIGCDSQYYQKTSVNLDSLSAALIALNNVNGIIVFMHYCPFAENSGLPGFQRVGNYPALQDTLEQYSNTKMVVNGHLHSYYETKTINNIYYWIQNRAANSDNDFAWIDVFSNNEFYIRHLKIK